MRKARLITIGTEITSGEVINSNASWVSLRLEDLGVRVFSHLSVRDQRDEILEALRYGGPDDVIVVTGGLGPTSDDITRECVAAYAGQPLEFDHEVWHALEAEYRKRGLPLREAHRHQCHFPRGSKRLPNPAGTALGFTLKHGQQDVFVLPGPPRELEGMWTQEVEPRLKKTLTGPSLEWVRWTCLGAPESEIAELVEGVIAGQGIEVGYRAQVPYVKVKLFVDPAQHALVIPEMERVLAPFLVARGFDDLAEELLRRWPLPELHVFDDVTGGLLFTRLLKFKTPTYPKLALHATAPGTGYGLTLGAREGNLITEVRLPRGTVTEERTLPFKITLASERGQRSAAEWAIWAAVKRLRAEPAVNTGV